MPGTPRTKAELLALIEAGIGVRGIDGQDLLDLIESGAIGSDVADPLSLDVLQLGATPATTGALRLSQGAISARGTLGIGAPHTIGDTMTISSALYGPQVYVWVAAGTAVVDGEINVDADHATDQNNVINAIFGSDGYNTGNLAVFPFELSGNPPTPADVITLSAILAGVAGNSITTTGTFADPFNDFDAPTLGTLRAGADAVHHVYARNSDNDGDVGLFASQSGGYGDWDAAVLGGPALGEILFKMAGGTRFAMNDEEGEFWFYNSGMTFIHNPYGTPRQQNIADGYLDLNFYHILQSAPHASASDLSNATKPITLRPMSWNGSANVEHDIDIYGDAWDSGKAYLYFGFDSQNKQIVMDEDRQFWPDADATGSLGKAAQTWGGIFATLPVSDPGVAGAFYTVDSAGLAAELAAGSRYVIVSNG